MPELVVEPADTRALRKQFLRLPWELYAGDPNWVPPLRSHQKELVGYKPHPFYDENRGQTFLALRDGKPVGRIAAIVNETHNRMHDERRGFFGFFESIDDREVAGRLFDVARRWLTEQGCESLRGPASPSCSSMS